MAQETPSLFNRVTDMIAEFIGWIGGREALTISRALLRKADKQLRNIEDTLRAALCLLAVDVVIAPIAAKPARTLPGNREAKPPNPRPAPAGIGRFNACPAPEPSSSPSPRAPAATNPRASTPQPDPTTEALLRRIARMEAVLADPLPYAERLARYLDATAPPISSIRPITPSEAPRRIDAATPLPARRSLLSLQPKWPPG